jgi:hypothetical protein
MKNLNRLLITALIQLVGNKRYFREIEILLNRLDEEAITPGEKTAVQYLIQDINQARHTASSAKRHF